MRRDRRSAYEQADLEFGEALQNELRHGIHALQASGAEGAQRFAAGAGRHGKF
jgi:enoyl-CoA hydratase